MNQTQTVVKAQSDEVLSRMEAYSETVWAAIENCGFDGDKKLALAIERDINGTGPAAQMARREHLKACRAARSAR